MDTDNIFLKIDIKEWIKETIKLVQSGEDWNNAWQKTYIELGGQSVESGKKSCPMNGTKTLYYLGRIKNSNIPYLNPPLQDVWNESKNGVYSLLTIKFLDKNPHWDIDKTWTEVQKYILKTLEKKPAKSNQGGPTVAYKLWHLGLIMNSTSDNKKWSK